MTTLKQYVISCVRGDKTDTDAALPKAYEQEQVDLLDIVQLYPCCHRSSSHCIVYNNKHKGSRRRNDRYIPVFPALRQAAALDKEDI